MGLRWWGRVRFIFISLFYARVAAELSFMGASDNWQQFCWAPPVQDEFVFFSQIAAQCAFGKVQPGFVNYSACHREKKISCHSRWEKGIKSGVRQNKILWYLCHFRLKVIDLYFSFFTRWDFFPINLTLTESWFQIQDASVTSQQRPVKTALMLYIMSYSLVQHH